MCVCVIYKKNCFFLNLSVPSNVIIEPSPASIAELPTAGVEALARFLPVVCDKLLQLLAAPPALASAPLNIAQDVFTALAQLFTDLTVSAPSTDH